jgi:two-component system phosphate regulon sensor histidine kinase PhoR
MQQNLRLTKPMVVLAAGVLLPVLLSSAVGIVALALWENPKDIVLGVLAVSFAAAAIGGGVIVTVLLGRRARLARLQGDLLGNVSHELKTPLSAIRMYAQTLQSGAVDSDAQAARACVDAIARETEWLGAMIERLLTWRAAARDRDNLEFVTAAVADVVGETAARFARMLPPGDADFAVAVSTQLPVRHDRNALASVLMNLLTNAYKYTRPPRRISLRAEDRDGNVVLTVQDNGIGIPERERRRIFEAFHRVESKPAAGAGGAGLGLAIVDALVKSHRGTVAVDSGEGEGSTFVVTLPAERGGE